MKMSNFLFWLVGKEWNRGKYVTATDKDSLIRGMQKYSEHLRKSLDGKTIVEIPIIFQMKLTNSWKRSLLE